MRMSTIAARYMVLKRIGPACIAPCGQITCANKQGFGKVGPVKKKQP